MSRAQKAEELRRLHNGPEMLILPNAWDAASARTLEKAGYPAIATTSGGVANSLGWKDGENMPADEMFAAVQRIASAVEIPVTADIEGGYGLHPDEVVAKLVATGAVGMNLEDSDHSGAGVLIEAEKQAARLAAVRKAADKRGVPLVINARVDVFVRQFGPEESRLDEALRRARLYLQAGADCLFPIILADEDTIDAFVAAIGAPVNIMYLPTIPSAARLREIGVRRLTFGSGLQRVAMARVEEFLRDF
ncbi:MAG: isocitrate lyase/phosphoenolpyruvate mutase family protein [Dehalococcoidia bacterium]